MAQYERNFTLEPNETPWVDADYDDVNYTFKLASGNLKPDTSTYEGTNYHRVVYTGESVDRTADSIYVEVTLGDGPSVYFDQGGPGWFINDASADQGKGYFLKQNGNSFSISRVDTNNSVGTNIGALGSHTTATGGKVGLEIYQINTSARIRAYYDGVVIGNSIGISADNYADKVVPGLSASYQNSNARGWTAIAIDGLDLGGFSLTDINGTGVIQNNDAIVINGDFASTTITSVTLSQSGATDEVITSITETDTQLTLAAIDFHTTDFMDGELTVTVTDGTTPITINATLDFSDDWLVDTAVSVDSAGMWKDIVGAVGTPVWSNSVWTATTETPVPPVPPGGEWAGLTPNKFASTKAELDARMADAVAGDVVGVYAGVYTGTQSANDNSDANRYYPAFTPANNGTASHKITFVAQWPAAYHDTPAQYTDLRSGSDGKDPDTGGTFIWGSGGEAHESEFGWPAIGSGWFAPGGDHVRYIGFYINGANGNNSIYDDCGYVDIRGKTGCTVTQCKIAGDPNRIYQDNNYSAIRVQDVVDCTISDSHLSNFGQGNINCQGVCSYYCTNLIVEHNYFTLVTEGHHVKTGASGGSGDGSINSAYYTISRYNHYYDCQKAYKLHYVGNAPDGQKSLFHNELIVDCANLLETATVLYNCATRMYNNTVIGPTSRNSWPGSFFFQTFGEDNDGTGRVYNNIFYDMDYYLGVGYTDEDAVTKMLNWGSWNYNSLYQTTRLTGMGGISLSTWQDTHGQDVNSLTSDPLFVGGGDYRLQAGSPCKGTGEGGVNMGCYITGDEEIGIRSA